MKLKVINFEGKKIDDIVKIGWMADKVMAFEETGQSLPTKSKS